MKHLNANATQIDGTHYRPKKVGGLQHWDLCDQYNVGYLESAATKYLSRFRHKAGVKDLRKARHFVLKLIEQRSAAGADLRCPNVPASAVTQFLADNDITGREVMYLTALFSWREVDMLRTVEISLEHFTEQYEAEQQAAEPGAGYVNQD